MDERHKIKYFSAGPAKLPDEVIERAQRELLSYQGSGVSMLEMSHRSKQFDDLMGRVQKNLHHLIPGSERFKPLFLQGGGTGQFMAIPLNLVNLGKGDRKSAEYVVTGSWSSQAAKEAAKYIDVTKCIDPGLKSYTRIPPQSEWKHNPDSAYLYYCSNETINGVEFFFTPESHGIPLVADMSSDFLSRPIDMAAHGIVYAGAQKNVGTSGVTIALVRDDLFEHKSPLCPIIVDYKTQRDNNSLYNTAPCFSIYITNLVLEWIIAQGGLDAMDSRADRKASLVYNAIDGSNGFYNCPVAKDCRSRMTIPFRIGSAEGVEAIEEEFFKEAMKRGMQGLKGHRSVGGMRASIYNAITVAETEALAEFMKEFEQKHHK